MRPTHSALPSPVRTGDIRRATFAPKLEGRVYLVLLQVGFSLFTTPRLGLGLSGRYLVSVPLSVGSRRLGITQRPALWSPDFPRRRLAPAARPPGPLSTYSIPPCASGTARAMDDKQSSAARSRLLEGWRTRRMRPEGSSHAPRRAQAGWQ